MPKISDSRRAAVRSRTLDAAQHLIARHGVQGTSMNQIVRASGLSKGAIYGHFASKADLVIALQSRILEGRLSETALHFQSGTSARERILRLLRTLLEGGGSSDRERARLSLQFTSAALQSPSLRAQVDARYDRMHRLFRDLLAEGTRSGEFRTDFDADATATAILALIDGLRVDWAFTSQDRFDPPQLLPTLERLLFCTIAVHTGGSSPARNKRPPRAQGVNPTARRTVPEHRTDL